MINFIAIFTLLLTQLMPTFGGAFGSAGNGFAFAVAIPGFTIAIFGYLLGKGVPRNFFLAVSAFYLTAAAYMLLVTVLSPIPFSVRDLSIIIKLATMCTAFISGYMFYLSRQSFKPYWKVVWTAFALNAVLLVFHFIDPFGPLQMLYFYREIGHHRFPGSWNHPYNLSIFFYGMVLYGAYIYSTNKNALKRIGAIALICVSIYTCLLATQSRSAFIAFWLTNIYGIIVFFMHSIGHNKGRNIMPSFILILFLLTGFAFIYQYLQMALEGGAYRHLNKLFDSDTQASKGRILELQIYYREYLLQAPWRIWTGFGTGRNNDDVSQTYMNYIFQYGIIGSLLFLFSIWISAWWVTLKKTLEIKQHNAAFVFLLINMFIVFVMLMGVSTNAITHYRLTPLAHFFFGMGYCYWQLNLKKRHAHYV